MMYNPETGEEEHAETEEEHIELGDKGWGHEKIEEIKEEDEEIDQEASDILDLAKVEPEREETEKETYSQKSHTGVPK